MLGHSVRLSAGLHVWLVELLQNGLINMVPCAVWAYTMHNLHFGDRGVKSIVTLKVDRTIGLVLFIPLFYSDSHT